MRKKVEVTCFNCQIQFSKDRSEVTRNKKLNRENYCSLKCHAKSRDYSHLVPFYGQNKIADYCNNRQDKFTGFREFIRRGNIKGRKYQVEVSLEYLLDVWENQKGICVYSGVQLVLPNKKSSKHEMASLDRIDSSKGYIEGNIQFISAAMNYMKNTMSHEETVELCKIIASHWKE